MYLVNLLSFWMTHKCVNIIAMMSPMFYPGLCQYPPVRDTVTVSRCVTLFIITYNDKNEIKVISAQKKMTVLYRSPPGNGVSLRATSVIWLIFNAEMRPHTQHSSLFVFLCSQIREKWRGWGLKQIVLVWPKLDLELEPNILVWSKEICQNFRLWFI